MWDLVDMLSFLWSPLLFCRTQDHSKLVCDHTNGVPIPSVAWRYFGNDGIVGYVVLKRSRRVRCQCTVDKP
ncbi:hypothetical protein BV22DRAFT_1028648 [Leucogyrophana mollusca]|uniref:Uncharacterized protein n=1 Tax=Leucogyrophana mollusca TaxID=85980 RepID=A0ACB8BX67_9AGAM|nr:hypothetical protein BV22DRAFT_1028648 [Leucogyrophana mollusca]